MKNEPLLDSSLCKEYNAIKLKTISGRYVSSAMLNSALKVLDDNVFINTLGESVEHRSIYKLKIGHGPYKILAWSQMHGNESTTTKAVLDLLNAFKIDPNNDLLNRFKEQCTLLCIPQLNPDGATAYTRFNANNVDLNRDAIDLSQPESTILHDIYNEYKPDLCLNLHDQRTIYNIKGSKNSSVVSFLSPAANKERDITYSRRVAMKYIAGIASELECVIPNKIGRYDDSFNINCVGDYFQSQGTPTILFEAGHVPKDYEREETRKLIFLSLLKVVEQATFGSFDDNVLEDYHNIPENRKQFYDVIIRNVKHENRLQDLAIQFREQLNGQNIRFIPEVASFGNLNTYFGHRELDAAGTSVKINGKKYIREGDTIENLLLNEERVDLI